MNDVSGDSSVSSRPGRVARFFDILGILGWLLAVPACLVVLGKAEEGRALERALGPFASPGGLLLGFAAAEDGKSLAKDLEESRQALEELKGLLDKEEPLLPGRDYARAVQPRDPAVSWSDYASPARRTLALGLAGDCDDFAILMASCVQAVGGRVRIVHGYSARTAHAWAEVWLGDGERGRSALVRAAAAAGRPGARLANLTDGQGGIWLVLDWRFGELSMRPDRMEVAWTGE